MADLIHARARMLLPAAFFLALAVALRWPFLGDPAADFDEQYYFLVGSKLLAGKLPYVDLWDRKPFGLFAVFAVASLIGGGQVLGYQLLAAASASVGAMQVCCIARRFGGGAVPGLVAGTFYLLGFSQLWSPIGQSEVFYIPLLLGMLQLVIAAWESDDPARVTRLATWAMLLGGVSLQIKYTPLPHCAFAGRALLARLRRLGLGWGAVAKRAAWFIALGLAPTALVAAGYAASGHFGDFWFANFVSIFGRGALLGERSEAHRINIAVNETPLALLAAAGLVTAALHRRRLVASGTLTAYLCIAGFAMASVISFTMLGNIYSHYFLPVVPGLALLSVPFFAVRRGNLFYALAAMALAIGIINFPRQLVRGRMDTAGVAEAARLIAPHIGPDIGSDIGLDRAPGHCLYIHDGPSILYQVTNSCLISAHAYPDHLNNWQEMNSAGIDTAAEVRRILAARPGAIVTADKPVVSVPNVLTAGLVRDAIRRDYVLAGTAHQWQRTLYVWVRRDERPGAGARRSLVLRPAGN